MSSLSPTADRSLLNGYLNDIDRRLSYYEVKNAIIDPGTICSDENVYCPYRAIHDMLDESKLYEAYMTPVGPMRPEGPEKPSVYDVVYQHSSWLPQVISQNDFDRLAKEVERQLGYVPSVSQELTIDYFSDPLNARKPLVAGYIVRDIKQQYEHPERYERPRVQKKPEYVRPTGNTLAKKLFGSYMGGGKEKVPLEKREYHTIVFTSPSGQRQELTAATMQEARMLASMLRAKGATDIQIL